MPPKFVNAPINSNNIELKLGWIQMACDHTYRGCPTKDPHKHLGEFLDIVETIMIKRVTINAIRLQFCPFSLQDRAKAWPKNSTFDKHHNLG